MTLRSWDTNAANWTRAVREGLIASRKAGTDEAVVQAILRRRPRRLLDVGCGEGWLVRRVTRLAGCVAVGVDGSAALIEAARAADPTNRYCHLTYDQLVGGERLIGAGADQDADAGFDVIVFNYALFDETAAALLAAMRSRLTPDGAVVIQTLHPWALSGGADYRDGWRSENFAAFEGSTLKDDWAPMPWFFRTLESWHGVVREAGLSLIELREPAAAPGETPLSLLLTCGAEP